MNSTPSPLFLEIEQDLKSYAQDIENTIENARNGSMANISSLNTRLETICGKIRRLPKEQASNIQSDVLTIVSKFEELEQEIHLHKNRLMDIINSRKDN